MKILLIVPFAFLNLFCLYGQNKPYSNEIKIQKIYESKIGSYYANIKDRPLVIKLDSFLVEKAAHLLYLFNDTAFEKIDFEFYSIPTKTKNFCGWNTAEIKSGFEPLGCTRYKGKIKLLQYGVFSNIDSLYNKWGGFDKVVLHEYMHILFCNLSKKQKMNRIPRWIVEGTAIYHSKQLLFNKAFKNIIDEKLINGSIPSIDEFSSIKKFHNISSFYNWSYLLCEFLIDNYGWNKLLKASVNNFDFYEILGKDEDKMNEEWSLYLKSKYPQPNGIK